MGVSDASMRLVQTGGIEWKEYPASLAIPSFVIVNFFLAELQIFRIYPSFDLLFACPNTQL